MLTNFVDLDKAFVDVIFDRMTLEEYQKLVEEDKIARMNMNLIIKDFKEMGIN